MLSASIEGVQRGSGGVAMSGDYWILEELLKSTYSWANEVEGASRSPRGIEFDDTRSP